MDEEEKKKIARELLKHRQDYLTILISMDLENNEFIPHEVTNGVLNILCGYERTGIKKVPKEEVVDYCTNKIYEEKKYMGNKETLKNRVEEILASLSAREYIGPINGYVKFPMNYEVIDEKNGNSEKENLEGKLEENSK